MAKDIFKEIVIVLLLFILIIAALLLLLYDYVPTKKMLPEEIQYSTSKEVKEELKNSSEVDEDTVILTYNLDQSDLNNYQSINDYRPGKTNPFSTYKSESVEKPSGETSTSGNAGSSSNGNGQTSIGGNTGGSSNGNGQTSTGSGKDASTPIAPGEVNPGNYTNNKGLK